MDADAFLRRVSKSEDAKLSTVDRTVLDVMQSEANRGLHVIRSLGIDGALAAQAEKKTVEGSEPKAKGRLL